MVSRRYTVSGAPPTVARPSHLPGVGTSQGPQTEPIPVPTQKLAYKQIQESLIRSRTRSGDSAMSGVSSAGSEGASTLGPLPEEGALKTLAAGGNRDPELGLLRKSPTSSPCHHLKSRRVSATAPPIPDICQLSPPNIQFTLGTTPPTGIGSGVCQVAGGRRRTSSSSSCGTPPPSAQWQVSPNSPIIGTAGSGRITPTMTSPVRRHTVGSRADPSCAQVTGTNQIGFYNNPSSSTLSPILGSPNKATIEGGIVELEGNNIQGDVLATQTNIRPRTGSNTSCGSGRLKGCSNTSKALMQWQGVPDTEGQLVQANRAGSGTVCVENFSETVGDIREGGRFRSSDLQFTAGRNVVLNYGAPQGFGGLFERSSKLVKVEFVITLVKTISNLIFSLSSSFTPFG